MFQVKGEPTDAARRARTLVYYGTMPIDSVKTDVSMQFYEGKLALEVISRHFLIFHIYIFRYIYVNSR